MTTEPTSVECTRLIAAMPRPAAASKHSTARPTRPPMRPIASPEITLPTMMPAPLALRSNPQGFCAQIHARVRQHRQPHQQWTSHKDRLCGDVEDEGPQLHVGPDEADASCDVAQHS